MATINIFNTFYRDMAGLTWVPLLNCSLIPLPFCYALNCSFAQCGTFFSVCCGVCHPSVLPAGAGQYPMSGCTGSPLASIVYSMHLLLYHWFCSHCTKYLINCPQNPHRPAAFASGPNAQAAFSLIDVRLARLPRPACVALQRAEWVED